MEGSPGNKVDIAKELGKGKGLIIGVPAAFSMFESSFWSHMQLAFPLLNGQPDYPLCEAVHTCLSHADGRGMMEQ
jgi:hypothetical protein